MAEGQRREPPYEGGAQPVQENPQDVPTGGRTAMQTVVIAIAVLVVLAGLAWFLIPLVST
jgi:hypothetical protein